MSIRQKIITLVCGMTCLACSVLGSYMFWHMYETSIDTAMNSLASETELTAVKFKDSYKEMINDAFITLKTPPIKGILRSRETGIDPKDGSSYDLWRSRLAEIFMSIMKSRHYYTQMRFIGFENNGKELVRVNRLNNGLEVVSTENLQEKITEPYMQRALSLIDNKPFFSSITYNREYNALDHRQTPTLRTLLPVFEGDKLFGLIVINVNFQTLLEKAFKETNPSHLMMVLTYEKDLAQYNPETQEVTLKLHEEGVEEGNENNVFDKVFSMSEDLATFVEDGMVFSVSKIHMWPLSKTEDFMSVILSVPKSVLLAKTYQTQYKIFGVSILIVLISLAIAGWVASKLMLPLQKVAHNISQNRSGRPQDLDLPINRLDEIGELSRSFYLLMENLAINKSKAQEVDSLVDGILTFNEKGVIQSVNQACLSIFGYQKQGLMGEDVISLFDKPCQEDYIAFLESYSNSSKKPISIIGKEFSGLMKNGKAFPVEVSVSVTNKEKHTLFTAIIRDITERKQVEQIKDSFVSTVNHEIRTPLTTIKGSLGLLKKFNAQLDERSQRLLELSYNNCNKLSRLVNDILDIEKIAAGKMEYCIECKDVTTLVKDTIHEHALIGEQYAVDFELKMNTPAPIYCDVDEGRFVQAVSNLLSNAAKFSNPRDTVIVKIFTEKMKSLKEKGANQNDFVIISVTDHGAGIPKDFQDKIFQRFSQADSSSTRSKGGTGLGLNITASIIQEFNGIVDFSTKEGVGTTFFIKLPLSSEKIDPSSYNNKKEHRKTT